MADQPKGVVIDLGVIVVGGFVALVGVFIAIVYLAFVPRMAERESRAACLGLKSQPPAEAVCGGQPCTLPVAAPDFTAIDHNGKQVHLSDFRGKVVLLNFWASWCGVCKTEKPQLAGMAEDLASDDFTVIALASDRSWSDVLLAIVEALAPNVKLPEDKEVSEDQAKAVYGQALPNGLPFHVFLDKPASEDTNIGAIASSWGIKAVPESALIDRKGNIRAYFVNKRDWKSPVAQTCLRSVIDE